MSQSYVKADSRGVDFVVVQRGFVAQSRPDFYVGSLLIRWS